MGVNEGSIFVYLNEFECAFRPASCNIAVGREVQMMTRIACVLAACLLTPGLAGAITIALTADAANSGLPDGGSVEALLTDGFAYNVQSPTSATPNLVWSSDSGYKGLAPSGSNVVISFTLDSAHTIDSFSTNVVVDVWGCSKGGWQIRDDDFDVILFDGNYSNAVASVLHLGVPDEDPLHARATFGLGIGETFDRFQIIGHDTAPGAGNPFTLMEVRMGLPIPLTWTGSSDSNWSNTANWIAGVLPVDNAPGTGDDEGLTMVHSDEVVFAGNTIPTNFPYIGGNIGGKDSPSLRFNSGGTTDLAVVGNDNSFWTTSEATRDVLTVGDGVGGGVEDVTLNLTMGAYLQRYGSNTTHNFVVNSDGTLSITSSASFLSFRYQSSSNQLARFTIAGGAVVINNPISGIKALAGNYIDFTKPGGSFTFWRGGDFPSIASVRSSLGVDFLNNTGWPYFRVVDNNDGTFTVGDGYRWTGATWDQDWSNAVNWVGGSVPVDSRLGTGDLEGLNVPYYNVIGLGGNNLPTNAPGLGGDDALNADTPSMVFVSGGTIDLALAGKGSDIWTSASGTTRAVFTVGDGIGGGAEDVVLNLTMADNLKRGGSGHHNFIVRSDGTLNIMPDAALEFGYNDLRTSSFTISGGRVVVNQSITGLSDYSGCFVEFTSRDGTFTAQYGGNFPDFAAVESSLGFDFIESIRHDGAVVEATDGGSTFTVTIGFVPTGAVLIVR